MRKNELNVDFLGSPIPLSPEQEKAISDFIAKRHGLITQLTKTKRSSIEQPNPISRTKNRARRQRLRQHRI